MAATNPWSTYKAPLDGPGNTFIATVIHDTSELATVARRTICETTGDICLVAPDDTSAIITINVAGTEIYALVKQIKSTGTSIASSAITLIG
jgi:hypothetical protein